MSVGTSHIPAKEATARLSAVEQLDDRPIQMHINFGKRFSKVARKEDDKVVVILLKAFAVLGLSEEKVDELMSSIAEEAAQVLAHQEDPKA